MIVLYLLTYNVTFSCFEVHENIHTPPPQKGVFRDPRGGLKELKFFRESTNKSWNLQKDWEGVWWVKLKALHGKDMDIFWNSKWLCDFQHKYM